ncbi:MAG: phosphoribosylformylglycinamidine synthase I [Planctomycetia bacterium]|nr:phosphoribosylformylglycinamidine synthase I [Planctomycetia bacterium]
MADVRALILRAPGANCDQEAAFALEQAGAKPDLVHINRLRERPALLHDYQLLLIPGGFTYGDDVAAGKILAVQLQTFLADALNQFRDAGKLILGICNGFQVLLKAGLIIPPDADQQVPATLANNLPHGFQDRWVTLGINPEHQCPFLEGYVTMEVPIAHGEGRFVTRDQATWQEMERHHQLVLRYIAGAGQRANQPYNPNGSQGDVAGACDPSGRVLGLMPHPDRHILPYQHPRWTRRGLAPQGDGLLLFQNAVAYLRR